MSRSIAADNVLINDIPAFFAILDANTGIITYANSYALLKLGFTAGMPVETAFWDAPCWSESESTRDRLRKTFIRARNILSANFDCPFAFDEEIKLKHWEKLHLSYYEGDATVRIFGIDISREMTLRNDMNRLLDGIDQLNFPVIMYRGPEHKHEFLNRSASQLAVRDDLIGKTLLEAFPGHDISGHQTRCDSLYKSNTAFTSWEDILHFPDEQTGSQLVHQYHFVPLTNERGLVDGLLVAAPSINEHIVQRKKDQKARLEAEQANRAKSDLLVNLCHEMTEQIEQLNSDADKQTLISTLLQTVDQVLDLTKIDTGKFALTTKTFSLKKELANFGNTYEQFAATKGMQFSMHLDHSLPDCVVSDKNRIMHIFRSMTDHALGWARSGTLSIGVRYRWGLLEFTIKDIDSIELQKAGFEKINLILARKLAIALGGDMRFEKSRVGKGSMWTVNMKVKAVTNIADKPVREKEVNRSELDSMRVLVIDDSNDSRFILGNFLRRSGASVDLARDGREGLEKAMNGPFDVVICDISMPIMNGHEAARRLRASGSQVPLVALTAHSMKEDEEKALRSGFTEYLAKPIQREVLISVIKRYQKHF